MHHADEIERSLAAFAAEGSSGVVVGPNLEDYDVLADGAVVGRICRRILSETEEFFSRIHPEDAGIDHKLSSRAQRQAASLREIEVAKFGRTR